MLSYVLLRACLSISALQHIMFCLSSPPLISIRVVGTYTLPCFLSPSLIMHPYLYV